METTTSIKTEWTLNHTALFEACRTMLEHEGNEKSWNNLMRTVLHIFTPRKLFDKTNAASGLSLIVTRAGGKTNELKSRILPNLPKYDRYFEPFVGGGSVFMGINANEYFINDFSTDLVSIYKNISVSDDRFFTCIEKIDQSLLKVDKFIEEKRNELIDIYNRFLFGVGMEIEYVIEEWCLLHQKEILDIVRDIAIVNPDILIKNLVVSLYKKLKKLKTAGVTDIDIIMNGFEYTLKAKQFKYYVSLYNNQYLAKSDRILHTALFFYILQCQFQGQQSFKKNGDISSSYGGNLTRRLNQKLIYFRSMALKEHFSNAHIYNMDFEEFLKTTKPTENDFIFLDPPYDETFSNYDNNEFGKEDHIRLANYLLTECKAKWMMIIKDTDFIYNLYNKSGIYIDAYNYQYRINKEGVTHLLITNYPSEETTVSDMEYREAA